MWLREACRHAVDAAQDSLVYISNQYTAAEACKVGFQSSTHKLFDADLKKTSRFTTFFIECSCDVLLYDILWHPSKHAFNLEYINTGIASLERMTQDEPMTNALASISRILQLVEQAIGQQPSIQRNSSQPASQTQQRPDHHTALAQQNVQFPSLLANPSESPANSFIHFSDRQTQAPSNRGPQDNTANTQSDGLDVSIATADPMSALDFDVLTTDLFNFFPTSLDNTFPIQGTLGSFETDNFGHGHGAM